jgi:hypothetical protein
MGEPLGLVGSVGTATIVFLVAMYATIRLVRRGRLPARVAAILLAVAGSALPWIVISFGLRWDIPSAIAFSAIVFLIVTVGSASAFERIRPGA